MSQTKEGNQITTIWRDCEKNAVDKNDNITKTGSEEKKCREIIYTHKKKGLNDLLCISILVRYQRSNDGANLKYAEK